jgi:hypothetical protein
MGISYGATLLGEAIPVLYRLEECTSEVLELPASRKSRV